MVGRATRVIFGGVFGLWLFSGCDEGAEFADDTTGSERRVADSRPDKEDAGADEPSASSPLLECAVRDGDVFSEPSAALGEDALAIALDGTELHSVYLTTTCRSDLNAAYEGLGVRYAALSSSGTMKVASEDVFANDAGACRMASDPAVTVLDGVAVAYFLSRDDLGVVRAYRQQVGDPSSPLPLNGSTRSQASLTAATLGNARLVVWAEASLREPDSIWTAIDDDAPQPVEVVSASEGFLPSRIVIAAISKSAALVAWSSTGTRTGIFATLVNKLGEPLGTIQRISDSAGEVAIARLPTPDDEGFAGAAAYTVAGDVHLRTFREDGTFADASRVVSQGASLASGPSITDAFGEGYAIAYRTRSLREEQQHSVVQMTVTDSRGNLAGRRVVAEVLEGGGTVHLRQSIDGRFFLAWVDGEQVFAQRFVCF